MRRLVIALAAAVVLLGAALLVARRLANPRGYSNAYGNTVVHYTLTSELVGQRLSEIGIVPRGGGKRGLLVFLHGRHDPAPWSWLLPRQTGPETVLSNSLMQAEAALGAQAPVIVILDGGAHSYYHDRAGGKWAGMVLQEAIPDAVERFGTTPGRIAIGGISMGGYGALHIASIDPGRFCAVGGHSPALWTAAGLSAPGAFDDATDFVANDVFAAARAGRFSGLPVWIDGGASDPFRVADAAFVALLRSLGVSITYHVWPGAHTHAYWASHMASYLAFYAHALANCRTA